MADDINERYAQKLKSNSDKAFAQLEKLGGSAGQAAAAAHTQLLNWLIQMDRVTRNPAELADDALANTACNVFEKVVTKQSKGADDKWAKLNEAFSALGDEDQLNLMRYIFAAVFGHQAVAAALLSRSSGNFLWENTAFHIDGDLRVAFAKVGRELYQAIGFDDGMHYIGTDGSKTLWTRDWAMAVLLPWAPPFTVTKQEVEELAEGPKLPDHLTEAEIPKIAGAIANMEEELAKYNKASAEAKKNAEADLRDTIKLVRIQVVRLDKHCEAWVDKNPEYGLNFEALEVTQLAITILEYLRMLLDNDKMHRQIQATVLCVGTPKEERAKLLDTLLSGIAQQLPLEGATVDGDAMNRRLDEAAQAIPEARDLLIQLKTQNPECSVLQAAKELMIWLQQERTKLDAK
jgi:hypothetical protein